MTAGQAVLGVAKILGTSRHRLCASLLAHAGGSLDDLLKSAGAIKSVRGKGLSTRNARSWSDWLSTRRSELDTLPILVSLHTLLSTPSVRTELERAVGKLGRTDWDRAMLPLDRVVYQSVSPYVNVILPGESFGLTRWLLVPPSNASEYNAALATELYASYLRALNGDYGLFSLTFGLWRSLSGSPVHRDIRAYGAYHIGLAAISHGAYYEARSIGEDIYQFAEVERDSFPSQLLSAVAADKAALGAIPLIQSRPSMVADGLRLVACATALGSLGSLSDAIACFEKLYDYLAEFEDGTERKAARRKSFSKEHMPDHLHQMRKADRELIRYAFRTHLSGLSSPGTGEGPASISNWPIRGKELRERMESYIQALSTPEVQSSASPLDIDTAARAAIMTEPDAARALSRASAARFLELSEDGFEEVDKRANALVLLGILATRVIIELTTGHLENAFLLWPYLRWVCSDESKLKHSRWIMMFLQRSLRRNVRWAVSDGSRGTPLQKVSPGLVRKLASAESSEAFYSLLNAEFPAWTPHPKGISGDVPEASRDCADFPFDHRQFREAASLLIQECSRRGLL